MDILRVGNQSEFLSPTGCSLLLDPIGCHLQFFERLRAIVRFDVNFEEVLAIHAFVHHHVHVNLRLLTWL